MRKKENAQVKMVPFMGTELAALKDSHGQIWAGVKWICEGIGLSDGQIKSERLKIQHDFVLSKGGRNFVLPTNGGSQETLCLKLDYVPLWLAKISITPKMREETPELAQRLEEYQLKAKDVLATAFLSGGSKDGSKPMTDYQKSVIEARERRDRVEAAKLLNQIAGDYTGTYRQILQAYAAKEIVGKFALPLPEMARETYTAEEIGAELGISANMVGRIANANNLKTDEYGQWFVDKAKHSAKEVRSFRYFDRVIPKIKSALNADE